MWWLVLLLAVPAWSQPGPPANPTLKSYNSPPAPLVGLAQQYQLKAGWNAISFPFRKITAWKNLSGLIDPTSGSELSPQEAQPGKGYWIYSASGGPATAWGEPQTTSCSLELNNGWNLVGNPQYDPLNLWQVTASDDHDFNRIWEEICPDWLDPRMINQGQVQALGPESSWIPGQAYWLFSRRPLRLRVSESAEIPEILRSSATPTGEQTLEGEKFGTLETGRLLLGSETVPNSSILDWSPTRVRFHRKPSDTACNLTLVAGSASSLRVPLTRPTSPQARHTVKVCSEDGQPIAGASIWLDGQFAGSTDRWGRALLMSAAPGMHKLRVTRQDFPPRELAWNIIEGRSTTAQVTLYSPLSQIWIRAMPCSGGFRPYRIEVYQKHNYTQRYFRIYSYERATPYADFVWNSVPANLEYRIDITWRDAQSYEKYLQVEKRLGRYGLQTTFYNYWGPPW